MTFWTMPGETETMVMLMDMLHPNVTQVPQVTGREVISGIAFRSQRVPKWPILLSLKDIVERLLQVG